MREIVINVCYGGFSLSTEAIIAYAKAKGKQVFGYINKEGSRVRYIHGKSEVPFFIYWLLEDLGDKPKKLEGKWLEDRSISRDDKDLVAIVKELKGKANGRFADLAVVKIPEDVKWHIEEYDGIEHVAEDHRTWS